MLADSRHPVPKHIMDNSRLTPEEIIELELEAAEPENYREAKLEFNKMMRKKEW